MERPRDLEAVARKFLPFFAIKAFDIVNPGVPFAANVGFLAIAQALYYRSLRLGRRANQQEDYPERTGIRPPTER